MPLKISRILHAGYLFESDGTQIAFDPIFENPFSRNCYAFPAVEFNDEKIRNIRLAAVFISHFHDDHCSLESLDLIDRNTPIYMFCVFDEMFSMIKELGFTTVFSLRLGEPVKIGSFTITAHEALDAEVDSIFQIQASGKNILNVVDSWIGLETLKSLQNLAPWDLILWPFQTMREIEVLSPKRAKASDGKLPAEWLDQLKILNPKAVVPSSCQFLQESWSWYNHAQFPVTYEGFRKQIEEILPKTKVLRLNPGTSIEMTPKSIERTEPIEWIRPIGDQNVDYQYDPTLRPPPTSEIAKNFPALSSEQKMRVRKFCEKEIIEKFATLDAFDDPYFRNSMAWKLSVYDHDGIKEDFWYDFSRDRLVVYQPGDLRLGWTTEIPAFKLFSSLETGESLTSMYLRINDCDFSAEIEKEIADVDPMDDPLVRCLYSGIFGEYQSAQLRKIKARKTLVSSQNE